MKISEYWIKVVQQFEDNPSWRLGQTYFNVLREYKPGLAAKVHASPYDPFYDDSKLPGFFEFVVLHWNDTDEIEAW